MASKSKILRRLVEVAPPILDRWTKKNTGQGSCILATRSGIVALQDFGIDAGPMSVNLVIHNAKMLAFLRRIDQDHLIPTKADWKQLERAGGWSVEQGSLDAQVTPGGWAGHLVIHVPDHQTLIDLDLGFCSRPHKDIVLPAAAGFAWPTGTTVMEYPGPGGCWLGIRATPDNQGFRDGSKDWTDPDRDHIGLEIARAIRKGK